MAENMTGPWLYALSQNSNCEGPDFCHWCGAPCERLWTHDDPPPIPFQKNIWLAKRPGNQFICKGCWLFRRKRITINNLDGTWRDYQSPILHSWWVTEDGSWTINSLTDKTKLYEKLLHPPLKFCLSLLVTQTKNLLQLTPVNDVHRIIADTPLTFSVDNNSMIYSVYELEYALRTEDYTGLEPGVQVLIRLLGPYLLPKEEEKKRGRGRPIGGKLEDPNLRDFKKVVNNPSENVKTTPQTNLQET